MDLGIREGPSPVKSEEYALPKRRVAGTANAIAGRMDPAAFGGNRHSGLGWTPTLGTTTTTTSVATTSSEATTAVEDEDIISQYSPHKTTIIKGWYTSNATSL